MHIHFRFFAGSSTHSQYNLRVDTVNCLVYVDKWNTDTKSYDPTDMVFLCSPGYDDITGNSVTPNMSETIKGIISKTDLKDGEWYYFPVDDCYVVFPVCIQGNYCFHGMPQPKGYANIPQSTLDAFGKPASLGCVRLAPRQALWVYENCVGCSVQVYHGKITKESKIIHANLMAEKTDKKKLSRFFSDRYNPIYI